MPIPPDSPPEKQTVFNDGTVGHIRRDEAISRLSAASGAELEDVAAFVDGVEARQRQLVASIRRKGKPPENAP